MVQKRIRFLKQSGATSAPLPGSTMILKAQGTAIIYVGHYVEEVERISTHLCFMEQGECKAFGTVKEVLEKTGKSTLSELLLGAANRS